MGNILTSQSSFVCIAETSFSVVGEVHRPVFLIGGRFFSQLIVLVESVDSNKSFMSVALWTALWILSIHDSPCMVFPREHFGGSSCFSIKEWINLLWPSQIRVVSSSLVYSLMRGLDFVELVIFLPQLLPFLGQNLPDLRFEISVWYFGVFVGYHVKSRCDYRVNFMVFLDSNTAQDPAEYHICLG